MLDKAYGCLLGTGIGDAMGMPASFMTARQIKKNYGRINDFLPPSEEQIVHGDLNEGEITDDTEEALIISSVLIEAGKFDTDLFVAKMKKWALDNKMLESTLIGPSTRRFLETIIKDGDYKETGKLGDTNGGAMRVAPVGIFNEGNVDKAIEDAYQSALPSHGSRPGIASTCAIAAAIAEAMKDDTTPRRVMLAAFKGAKIGEEKGYDIPSPSVSMRIKLAMDIVDENKDKDLDEICYILSEIIGASMKSYESIPLSLGVFYAARGEFEKGLVSVINLGDDADTNGSIVGGLCGAYSGAGKIKAEWIEKVSSSNKLDFKEIAQNLLK